MGTTLETIQQRLANSHLLTADEAAAKANEWQASADGQPPEAFIDWLVEQEQITDFQGEAILDGHTGPFMLGPYDVHEHIAHGWLGGIFRARHIEYDQPVALKIYVANVTDDSERLARMGRELRIACELDHPNVVRAFEVGEVGHISYMAIEDLHGETLADRLAHDGRLPLEEACRLGRDLARGLAALHEQGIVVRDIRPENIWLTSDGVPKLMEFGGAKDSLGFLDSGKEGEELSSGDTVIGEYLYMAPEQAQDVRAADARSDIYALGCVLYHCLTGRPPFESKNNIKLAMMHATQSARLIAEQVDGLPKGIDDAVAGMIAKSPADRFPSAAEAAYALDHYVPEAAEVPTPLVELSPHYLEHVQAKQTGPAQRTVADHAVGVSPELTNFLNWMGNKKVRKRRRS